MRYRVSYYRSKDKTRKKVDGITVEEESEIDLIIEETLAVGTDRPPVKCILLADVVGDLVTVNGYDQSKRFLELMTALGSVQPKA